MDCCRKSCVIHDANIEIFLFVTIIVTFNLKINLRFNETFLRKEQSLIFKNSTHELFLRNINNTSGN